VKSTARLFGAQAGRWLAGFLGLTVVLLAAAVIATLPAARGPWPMLLALAGVWAMGAHMVRQMRILQPEDPASCLRIFKSNRDAGLILVLFLAGAALV
jgi:4-hydroxybenzoate polyprenyltransferase